MMKLFLVTHKAGVHKQAKIKTTYVAAESMEIVKRSYQAKKIELIHDTVVVLRTPEDLKSES